MCLELLIPNMYFIPGFFEPRAEFHARKWNLKQKWHFLRLKSLEMKKIIDVGYHFVRLEMLIPNMWFITWFLEARAEFRAWKWNLKQKWVMGEWNFASIFLSLMRVSPINLGSESSSSNKLCPHECRSYFVWQLLGGAKIENSYLTKERCWGVDRERERWKSLCSQQARTMFKQALKNLEWQFHSVW